MDSTAAIAKAIKDLDCDDAVKDALKALFVAQVGNSAVLPKKAFADVIELKYETWTETSISQAKEDN
jgi:hypothetical protein